MKLAVAAVAHNEAELVPQFLRHYAPQVDAVFVSDNESGDGTPDIVRGCGYPNVALADLRTGGVFDDNAINGELRRIQARCAAEGYDYMLQVDVDEFVVARAGGPIKEELEGLPPADVYGTLGFCMFQGPNEGLYDPDVPLFVQRRWGHFSSHYSKPIILRPGSNARYPLGRHTVEGVKVPKLFDWESAKFVLLHYIGVSEEIFVKRRYHNRLNRMPGYRLSANEGAVRQEFRGARASQDLHPVELPALLDVVARKARIYGDL